MHTNDKNIKHEKTKLELSSNSDSDSDFPNDGNGNDSSSGSNVQIYCRCPVGKCKNCKCVKNKTLCNRKCHSGDNNINCQNNFKNKKSKSKFKQKRKSVLKDDSSSSDDDENNFSNLNKIINESKEIESKILAQDSDSSDNEDSEVTIIETKRSNVPVAIVASRILEAINNAQFHPYNYGHYNNYGNYGNYREQNQKLSQLINMGFNSDTSLSVLIGKNYDLNETISALLEMNEIDDSDVSDDSHINSDDSHVNSKGKKVENGNGNENENVIESESNKCCKICLVNEKSHAFMPCGHFVSCASCAFKIKNTDGRCPMCRKFTTQVTKIFTC